MENNKKTKLTSEEITKLDRLTLKHPDGRPGPKPTNEFAPGQSNPQGLAKQLRPQSLPYEAKRKAADAAAALNISWINQLKASYDSDSSDT